MQFNEFNRRLQKCHLDEDTKHLLAHMFEVQVELNKQVDMAASLIEGLVNTVGSFVQLHESTQGKVKQLLSEGREKGVEVMSVPNEPEPN